MKHKFEKLNTLEINHFISFRILALLLCFFYASWGFSLSAQDTKITLKIKQQPLGEVLNQIELKTGYSFLVRSNDVNLKELVTIEIINKTVNDVLNILFKKQAISFEITGKSISIFKPQKSQNTSPVPASKPQKRATGIVLDEKGLPVIGANIKILGSNIGVITDINGRFSIEVPINTKLRVSYIGYDAKEEEIKIGSDMIISLEQSLKSLEEVVVVGYGTQKKISVTGAISSVGNEFLIKSPNSAISNTLAGRVTGLSTVQYSGQPGSDEPAIFVRGLGSLTSDASSPLMLVDGVERSFNQIDPNEVESVTVLKDASATAVYGIRGANGVIIVTTKRGTEGAPKISFTMSTGMQTPSRLVKMADSYTYAMKYNEGQLSDNPLISPSSLMFTPEAIKAFKTGSNPFIYPNTDWVGQIVKPYSPQSQYNINISGGSKVAKYFVSLGYLSQDGQFNTFNTADTYNFGYKRYNYRANVDLQMTKTTTLAFTTGGRVEVRQQPGQMAYDGVFPVLYGAVPFAGLISDSKLYLIGQNQVGMSGTYNGAQAVGFGTGYQNATSNILNLDIQLSQKLDFITKGLNWRLKYSNNSTVGFTKSRQKSKAYYTPKYLTNVPGPNFNKGDSTVVFVQNGTDGLIGYGESSWNARNWYMESAFSYDRTFGNHQITGLLLYNESKIYYPSVYNDIPTGYVGLAARGTYNYKSKYLVDFNLGYNGSENFATDKRFGFFPAISAGWVMTEEKFLKDKVSFLDFLKLRMSYGEVGNDRQGSSRFLYLPDSYITNTNPGGLNAGNNVLAGGYSFGINDPTMHITAAEGKIGNPGVTWEKAKKTDIGIDVKLLSGKLGITGDVFYEYRNNILTTRNTVPNILSFNLPAVNIGEVENKGFEAEVKWRDKIGNVNYYITGNVSYAKNKILYMDEIPRNEPYLYQTGKSVNQPFGYVFTGFWSANEVAQYNDLDAQGKRITPDYLYMPKPGDCKYQDLNGDGKINSDDQQAMGFPDYPEFNFSLSGGLSYKGFDFSMMWTGASNVSRSFNSTWRVAFGGTHVSGLLQWLADNSWTPETANTALAPRISFTSSDNNTKNSSLWLRDASYIRLKNVEIGYNFAGSALKKLGISGVRVYTNGYNLLTFDKLKFIDPESRTNSADYPLITIYNVGINVNF
ncbi:MAG: TonB-dependent receptor [Paludibacter sp.]|nr:TonB-dependent receptor [Paludibacter sp.]